MTTSAVSVYRPNVTMASSAQSIVARIWKTVVDLSRPMKTGMATMTLLAEVLMTVR